MALSAARDTAQMGKGRGRRNYPVLTAVKIYNGALVAIDANGYAKPAVSATSLVIAGRACKTVDNTSGQSGDLYVDVDQGSFSWDVNGTAFGITDVGSLCWAYDDHTVTLDSTSRSIAGTVQAVNSNGSVFVDSGLAAPLDGTTIAAVATDLSTAISANAAMAIPKGVYAPLSNIASGAVVMRFTPGVACKLRKLNAEVVRASSTTAKALTLQPYVSGVAVSGGLLSLTSLTSGTGSGNTHTQGFAISGSVICGANSVSSTQEVTIVASGVTAFAEGEVMLDLYFAPA